MKFKVGDFISPKKPNPVWNHTEVAKIENTSTDGVAYYVSFWNSKGNKFVYDYDKDYIDDNFLLASKAIIVLYS